MLVCLNFVINIFISEGFVEMVIPWQFCQTMCPLLSQRLPFASAKIQPR